MKKEKTVVEGYTIIKQEQVGEAMVVLGHNPSSPLTPFVTWKAYEHDKFRSFKQRKAKEILTLTQSRNNEA